MGGALANEERPRAANTLGHSMATPLAMLSVPNMGSRDVPVHNLATPRYAQPAGVS